MKTDRFDEEFRRKLLGLPAEADPGEVERIQGYVNANKPAVPSPGWGRLLLYGGGSLLLIGSLSYNLLQTYRNTRLQSSIDSLAHRSVNQATPETVIRHDTVYITRFGKSENVGPTEVAPTDAASASDGTGSRRTLPVTDPQPAGRETIGGTTPVPSDGTGRIGLVAKERNESPRSGNESRPVQPESGATVVAVKPNRSRTAIGSTASDQRIAQSGQVHPEGDSVAATLPVVPSEHLATEKIASANRKGIATKPGRNGFEPVAEASPDASLSVGARSNRRRSRIRQTVSVNDKDAQIADNHPSKSKQYRNYNSSKTGFPPISTENATAHEIKSEPNRQMLAVEPLTSRLAIPSSNSLAVIRPSRNLVIPKNESTARTTTHRPWHLTLPRLSVPNAQYRLGVGLTAGGRDQFGGSLLGEVMISPRWSVQGGVRLLVGQGFHYRDEQEFDEHQEDDFRQTYASQVPASSDIQDIKQMSVLVQVPLQVAYHLPLGRQWGLRLGVGTDLDLFVRSVVSYNYRESSRSSEHGLSLIEEPVHIFNNLTLSTSIERSWKKWVFRAGPFISPQLQPVGYKPEDLSWGGNLQVFYRLGK